MWQLLIPLYFLHRKLLLLEMASRFPDILLYVVTRSRIYASLMKMWKSIHSTSLSYSWNLLLEAGLFGADKNGTENATFMDDGDGNSSNASSSRRRTSAPPGEPAAEAAMHVLDQWVLSQHRSMKLLHGDQNFVAFMEDHVVKQMMMASSSSSPPPPPSPAYDDAASNLRNKKRMGESEARNLLLMQHRLMESISSYGAAAVPSSLSNSSLQNNRSNSSSGSNARRLHQQRGDPADWRSRAGGQCHQGVFQHHCCDKGLLQRQGGQECRHRFMAAGASAVATSLQPSSGRRGGAKVHGSAGNI